ncbi:MCP four helix bundle domain-containing protein [Marinilabilia salmonicolor]|uniref:histidine kinase n=1 Tax=Marinilabilia salmonicolor TaxID=989 RepID=A0A368VB68_9BACT|nr:MCP four helix bundle domain-containing protein [Marinilabilia salmonicolor]RCW38362.1 chemoreceptor-like protein with four helix bundle sensory module [Marinilabilia salmonicolor]
MKKTLKLKIFASFMLLIAMLAIAGAISILEFRWLSNSVHGLIEDNYKSIEASKKMAEALEREDSGILLLMLGEWEEGRDIIESADRSFQAAFKVAKNNLTEDEEEKYIKDIEEAYRIYKSSWQRPIVDTDKQGDIAWYKDDIHKKFADTKSAVNELMSLNQSSMYNEVSELKEKSKRAIMPGIVSIIAALVFSIILNFFITKYFVNPISELAHAVNSYRDGDKSLRVDISSNDEIKKLENAINDLLHRGLKNFNTTKK